MIAITKSTTVLQAVLAAVPATKQPVFTAAYADNGQSTSVGSAQGSLNGVTPVTVVSGPASGSQRVVGTLTLYNADTASVMVTLQVFDGTTAFPVITVKLAPGYTLSMTRDGFKVTDGQGAEILPNPDNGFRVVIPFAFGDASPVTIFTPPAGCTDILARVVIDTPFNGVGASIQLGTASSPGSLVPAGYVDPTTPAGYEAAPDKTMMAGTPIVLAIVPGTGATQGAGRVVFDSIPA